MVKTTSGKKATVRGSGESKRAVAHSRSASSPGVSKTSVKIGRTQGAMQNVKQNVKRKTAAALARTAKVAGTSTRKALGQASRQAKEQASAKEAAAIAGRKRNTKQESKQTRVRLVKRQPARDPAKDMRYRQGTQDEAARAHSVSTVPSAVVQQPRVETKAGMANSMTKKLNEVPVDDDATRNATATDSAAADPAAAVPVKVEKVKARDRRAKEKALLKDAFASTAPGTAEELEERRAKLRALLRPACPADGAFLALQGLSPAGASRGACESLSTPPA